MSRSSWGLSPTATVLIRRQLAGSFGRGRSWMWIAGPPLNWSWIACMVMAGTGCSNLGS